MKQFFWLKQEDRIDYVVLLKGIVQQISLSDLSKGVLDSVPDLTVFPVTISSNHNIYPDVLSSQIFMIKNRIKQVFDLMDKKTKYKKIYAMDASNEISHLY